MDQIWVNRLIAEEQLWSEVPVKRRIRVKVILLDMVEAGTITQEKFDEILSK